MVLSLLLQVNEDSMVKGKAGDDLDKGLAALLDDHKTKLAERQGIVVAAIEKMLEEDKKKITSDGIREGWSAGVRCGLV